MYKTPQKDASNGGGCCNNDAHMITLAGSLSTLSIDVCSVCLSPCGKASGSSSTPSSSTAKKAAVETKCKHHFHETCLNEAKAMKPECPMCRCPLTPLSDDKAVEYPNLMRQAVVSAAQRGRNAVRDRMLRMERERAQQALASSEPVQ